MSRSATGASASEAVVSEDAPASEQPVRDTHAARVGRLREQIEEGLDGLMRRSTPAGLYEPARYVLEGQGKRLRPLLLLLTAETFGARVAEALPAALAVEVFHNFTLVHDDIMDRADSRRGRPTVHVRWDEDTALLVGDVLMARSYELLAETASGETASGETASGETASGETASETERVETARLMQSFSRMARRLCEGQALDKAFERRPEVGVSAYLDMIDGKTGALLGASLELGGLVGRASDRRARALKKAGRDVGRAFQIQDDLLDLTAEDDRWGKAVGGDLMEGKKTYLLLRALERSEGKGHAWFARAAGADGLPADQVPEARRRMEALGVLRDAREAVARHTQAATEGLTVLPDRPAADTLRWLIEKMQKRMH